MKKRIKSFFKLGLKLLGVVINVRKEQAILQKSRIKDKASIKALNADLYMVGCGVMGRSIAKSVIDIKEFKLREVCDLSESAAHSLIQSFAPKAKYQKNYLELVESAAHSSKGILIIATTAKSHYSLFKTAVEKGVRKIFLEKPLSVSLEEGRAMIELAEKYNVLVNVDHVRRWLSPIEGVKRILNSDVIGRPVSASYVFGRSGFAMIGTHIFDLFRYLFDSDIARVRGHLDDIIRANWRGEEFEDQSGYAEATLANGIRIYADLSDALEIQQDSFVIYGTKGRLEVDQRMQVIRLVGGAGRIWEESYQWFESFENGLSLSLLELVSGKTPRCGLLDAYKALEAVIAIHESKNQNEDWINLPLEGSIISEKFPFA